MSKKFTLEEIGEIAIDLAVDNSIEGALAHNAALVMLVERVKLISEEGNLVVKLAEQCKVIPIDRNKGKKRR